MPILRKLLSKRFSFGLKKGFFKTYLHLVKPGIVVGNTMATTGGFFLASRGHIDLKLFLATIVGTMLIIASAGALNNVIDLKIDSKMERTKKRSVVSGLVSRNSAIIFGSLLGLIGFAILVTQTNLLVVIAGLTGYLGYLIVYGAAKRRTVHGTLIGSIPGAMPPVAGYVAVTGRLDLAAVLLFVIMAIWQMPHFYAIAVRRKDDYASAGLPVISVVSGVMATKRLMVAYIGIYLISTALLGLAGYTGLVYSVVMLIAGLLWLKHTFGGLNTTDNSLWAKNNMKLSLRVLMTFCLLLVFEAWLP